MPRQVKCSIVAIETDDGRLSVNMVMDPEAEGSVACALIMALCAKVDAIMREVMPQAKLVTERNREA